MKNLLPTFTLFLCLLSVAACRKNSNPTIDTNNTNVMFVNVCTNGTNPFLVDGHVGDSAIFSATALGICGYSGYATIPVSNNTHISYWSGGNQLIDSMANLGYNDFYSAFLCGTPSKPRLIIVQDVFNLPSQGYASIRFLNFCPNSPRLDCYVGSELVDTMQSFVADYPFGVYLNSGFAPVNVYDFIPVPAGTVQLIMQDVANTSYNAYYDNCQLIAGRQYTAICTDTASSPVSTAHHLKITIINNH